MPVIGKKYSPFPARLTTRGYKQLVKLGTLVQIEYSQLMGIRDFKKATVSAVASSRERCTDSAQAFFDGLDNKHMADMMLRKGEFCNKFICFLTYLEWFDHTFSRIWVIRYWYHEISILLNWMLIEFLISFPLFIS